MHLESFWTVRRSHAMQKGKWSISSPWAGKWWWDGRKRGIECTMHNPLRTWEVPEQLSWKELSLSQEHYLSEKRNVFSTTEQKSHIKGGRKCVDLEIIEPRTILGNVSRTSRISCIDTFLSDGNLSPFDITILPTHSRLAKTLHSKGHKCPPSLQLTVDLSRLAIDQQTERMA